MNRNYLVAWDGTESAEKALEYAAMLASSSSGKLHMWQSFHPPRMRAMMMSRDMRDIYDRWIQDKCDEMARAMERRAESIPSRGLPIDTEVHVGDVLDGLIAEAQRTGADFIVLGKGKEKNRIGSLVLKVLRATRRPVIVVPAEFDVRPPSHVLVPIDLTIQDSASMDVAIDLAQVFDLKIDVLHVVEIYIYESPDAIKEVLDKLVFEELNQWKEINLRKAENISIQTHVRKAIDAASGIQEFVESEGINLMIMDSHTRSGLMHFLLGSVAEKIIRGASIPVILTKPEL